MKCIYCNFENEEDTHICKKCGNELIIKQKVIIEDDDTSEEVEEIEEVEDDEVEDEDVEEYEEDELVEDEEEVDGEEEVEDDEEEKKPNILFLIIGLILIGMGFAVLFFPFGKDDSKDNKVSKNNCSEYDVKNKFGDLDINCSYENNKLTIKVNEESLKDTNSILNNLEVKGSNKNNVVIVDNISIGEKPISFKVERTDTDANKYYINDVLLTSANPGSVMIINSYLVVFTYNSASGPFNENVYIINSTGAVEQKVENAYIERSGATLEYDKLPFNGKKYSELTESERNQYADTGKMTINSGYIEVSKNTKTKIIKDRAA